MQAPYINKDLYPNIVNCFELSPLEVTEKGVRKLGREVRALSLVDKRFHVASQTKLRQLQRICELVMKYCKYNDEYINPGEFCGEIINPRGNPQLLDAIFTGCRLFGAMSTYKQYSQEIEEDIKDIVKFTPQSIKCSLGQLRSRYGVTPLVAACFNRNIPNHVIEFLLQNGADPNETYELNGFRISILRDLDDNPKNPGVAELLVRYGGKKI